MDVVKQLIQYVTRGFCELRSILIMDAILLHGVYVSCRAIYFPEVSAPRLR